MINIGNLNIYKDNLTCSNIDFSINSEITDKKITLFFHNEQELIFNQEFKLNYVQLDLDIANLNKIITYLTLSLDYNDKIDIYLKCGKTENTKDFNSNNLGYIKNNIELDKSIEFSIYNNNELKPYKISGIFQINMIIDYLALCKDIFLHKLVKCSEKEQPQSSFIPAPSF